MRLSKSRKTNICDYVLGLLEEIKVYFGCEKVVFVPINPFLKKILLKAAQEDSRSCHVFKLDFIDRVSAEKLKLPVVARSDQDMVRGLILESIDDKYTGQNVIVTPRRMALLFRSYRGSYENMFAIQAEFEETYDQLKRAPENSKTRDAKHIWQKLALNISTSLKSITISSKGPANLTKT